MKEAANESCQYLGRKAEGRRKGTTCGNERKRDKRAGRKNDEMYASGEEEGYEGEVP